MKKLISLSVCIFVLFVNAQVARAENDKARKLSRGIVNIISAPVEVPKQTRAYWIEGSEKTDHILVWLFAGFVKGGVETVKRAGSGLWDVVTFPFEKPAGYEPLLKPDYVLDDWPNRD